MFDDIACNFDRMDAQHQEYQAWVDALPAGTKLAVVEVSAGLTISTIRDFAEETVSRLPAATLVRINLEAAQVPEPLSKASKAVSIPLGGLDALQRLDHLVRNS